MKTEQEFLHEVIKRANKRKAKRRAYISVFTVCICIAITAVVIPLINRQNSALPPSAQDSSVTKRHLDSDVCIDFYTNADLMCNVNEISEIIISDNADTANSASKSENDEATIDKNSAASGYVTYPFQTQNMTGIYTVTDSGFEVAIINSRGEQKLYTLDKNVMYTNLGTVTELTDGQIRLLNDILKESLD